MDPLQEWRMDVDLNYELHLLHFFVLSPFSQLHRRRFRQCIVAALLRDGSDMNLITRSHIISLTLQI